MVSREILKAVNRVWIVPKNMYGLSMQNGMQSMLRPAQGALRRVQDVH
jgi:hypothetical protein